MTVAWPPACPQQTGHRRTRTRACNLLTRSVPAHASAYASAYAPAYAPASMHDPPSRRTAFGGWTTQLRPWFDWKAASSPTQPKAVEVRRRIVLGCEEAESTRPHHEETRRARAHTEALRSIRGRDVCPKPVRVLLVYPDPKPCQGLRARNRKSSADRFALRDARESTREKTHAPLTRWRRSPRHPEPPARTPRCRTALPEDGYASRWFPLPWAAARPR